jgi:hypothetical protein
MCVGEWQMETTEERKGAEPADGRSAGDLFEALIDRIADRVVEKLEEQRKIDLIAGAVIQRIRLGAHYQEATQEPDPANSGT